MEIGPSYTLVQKHVKTKSGTWISKINKPTHDPIKGLRKNLLFYKGLLEEKTSQT
jgi:hypothetical protein